MDHVTKLTGFFLVTESYPTMGDISVSGYLSNNIIKYNPDLFYYHKPHNLTY